MTFTSFDSHAKVPATIGARPFKISFEFRTHEEDGILMRYDLGSTDQYILVNINMTLTDRSIYIGK